MPSNLSQPKLDFGAVLAALKQGRRLSRERWVTPGWWIELQTPDANSKMGVPYIYMRMTDGKFCPWLPTFEAMFAEDWIIV